MRKEGKTYSLDCEPTLHAGVCEFRLSLADGTVCEDFVLTAEELGALQKESALLPQSKTELAAMLRESVCQIARDELGKRDLERYWLESFTAFDPSIAKLSWCGIFDLYCLRRAGLTSAKWVLRVGFLGAAGCKQTKTPQPGDTAYFQKQQHYAIVTCVREALGDKLVDLIQGNGEGGVVTASTCKVANVTAFYSIQSLVDKAVKAR